MHHWSDGQTNTVVCKQPDPCFIILMDSNEDHNLQKEHKTYTSDWVQKPKRKVFNDVSFEALAKIWEPEK